jgi:hypothetical protein
MNRHKIENEQLNLRELYLRIEEILNKFQILDRYEIEEWKRIQENKIAQLARGTQAEMQNGGDEQSSPTVRSKLRALKEHLRILVSVCNQLESTDLHEYSGVPPG